jgi:hypothetical protein
MDDGVRLPDRVRDKVACFPVTGRRENRDQPWRW